MSDVTDLIKELKDHVDASEAAYSDWRREAKEDLLMKAGEGHWPGTTAQDREAEGRPALVVNQLPQFTQGVIGSFRLNQFAISLKPADGGADLQTAKVMEGLVRAIQYDSSAKVAYRFALQNAVDGGLGWLRVDAEYEAWDSWDYVLKINPVYNPFSVYPDASSVRWDMDDAWRLAVLEEMPIAVYQKKWPKAGTKDIEGGTGNQKRSWVNDRDKTITVAELWRKVPVKKTLALIGDPESPGTWRSIEVTREVEARFLQQGGVLLLQADDGLIPVIRQRKVDAHKLEVCLASGADQLETWKEQPGRYFPLIPVPGEEVHVDGVRRLWGLIRHAKNPQRIWNYQWTAAVEAVGMQPKVPWVGTQAQFEGFEDLWDASNRQNVSRLVYNADPQAPGPPQRQPPPVTPVAALALVEKAESMLRSSTGIYESALGQKSNESSGIAIQKRQMATTATTATYPDNLTLAMEHLGRVLLERIPSYYDNERVIRILGDDFTQTEQVRVNGSGGVDLTKGRYDVVATIGPAYATKREESLTQMTEFARDVVGQPHSLLIADLLAGLTEQPDREKLVERLKMIQAAQGFTEDGQPPPQMLDQIMQVVMEANQRMVPQLVAMVLGGMEEPAPEPMAP